MIFSPNFKKFHSYGEVTIGEGLLILTYVRHSCQLSSEGSLACHTYCEKRACIYNDHLQVPVTLTHVAEHLAVELSLPVFIPPANKVWGVYSDPYVRPFVRSFVRPNL